MIVPFLRGYGATTFLSAKSMRNGQQSAFALDAIELMDALKIDAATIAGFDWGARTACIVAALWPERCRALVSVSGYLVGSQSAGKTPLPPSAELQWWYQYYFATNRGREGYEKYTSDFAKLIWRLASPRWAFDDDTFARSAASFSNPDHVAIVVYRLSMIVDFGPQIAQNRFDGRLRGRPNPRSEGPLMSKKTLSAVDRRAHELDTIAAVLPMERRDELAELLTDADVETLRHLVNQGMGSNTLRALTSDLAYLEAWGLAATGSALPWPAPEALQLKFVAQHLWDSEKRAIDPDHGMPAVIDESLRSQGFLKSSGPHAPATVRRRLASWSTLTRWRGLDGAFASPALKSAIRLAVRASSRQRRRKSARAVTGDVLSKLLATCSSNSLRDVRDRAILMVAFASGGRRRSEVASLRFEQLTVEQPIEIAGGPPLPSLAIHLGRTKTANGEQDDVVYLTGRPVESLEAWLAVAKIDKGSVFRGIGRWGTISRRALDPQSVNAILKQRAEMAGLEPADYSAHGLRSGYLTEAANRGIPLPEAMEQSRHRSVQQATSYYNNATRRTGKAARLL